MDKRCECPEESKVDPEYEHLYRPEEYAGMNHEPNECMGTYDLRKYRRMDKTLYLCSCCTLHGDIPVMEN